MKREDINRDFDAMFKFAEMIPSLMDTSEEMFKSIISGTVDLYAIRHDKDRIEMMVNMIEIMKRCPL